MPDDVDDGRLLQSWIAMAKEARELWIPRRVPTVDTRDLTPLAFQRKFVGPNTPVLIRGGCRHWPAFDRWTNSYLLERMGSSQLTVALTPDGHGDCPVGGRFVLPHEERMDLAAFFETLRDPSGNAVPYIQKQCNSLDEEFGQLRDDIAELEIGKTVFEHLDATNLWIGDERAVSATHSDPYENLYCVVAGTKHVTLYPPTDLPFLYRKTFSVGQYVREPSGSFSIIKRPGTVPWISVDPSDRRQFPLYEYASPLEVEVQAGDVLYLPALWYHRVSQSADLEGRTIAVNFWYDMQFDSRYTWMRFQESLVANGC